jgi:hypothetical protein
VLATLIKDAFIGKWQRWFGKSLFGIAGSLTASATNTAGQIYQNTSGFFISFYLMGVAFIWTNQ